MEQNGYDPRRQQRDEQVAMRLEDHVERTNDEHIDADDAGGEHAVDECPVDQNVNIKEVRAKYSDPNGNWNEQ